MPEIKELFNNEASYNFVDYTSEWLNCSALKSIVITTFLDCDYTVSIEWSIDNDYFIIETDTVNKLASEINTFQSDIKARFCRLKIENISIPCLLQSQGFFYTKTKTGFSIENLGGGIELYNNNLKGVKTLVAGLNIGIVENDTEVEISNVAPLYEITNVIEQSGGNVILFSDPTGPEIISRSLNNGVGINLSQTATSIILDNVLPSTLININSTGGGFNLINSNVNPNFSLKTLIAGSDISIVDNGNELVLINSRTVGITPYEQSGALIEPISNSVNSILSGTLNNIIAASNSSISSSSSCEISGSRSNNCTIASSSLCDIKTTASNGSGVQCSLISCTNCTSNFNAGTNISMISSIDAVTSGSAHSSLLSTSSCVLNAVTTCLISSSLSSSIVGSRSQLCTILSSDNSIISTSSSNGIGDRCLILGSNSCGIGNTVGIGNNAGDSVSIISSINSYIPDRSEYCSILSSSNSIMSGSCENTIFLSGENNSNTGNRNNCLVVGTNNILNNNNCFMWSDGSGGMGNALQTNSNNQFLVKCTGGSTFYSNTNLTSGVFLGGGSASWASICDIDKKQNLVIVDNVDILNKIKQLPIYSYNYVGNVQQLKHISTTAQAWYDLFPCECIIKDVLDQEGNQTLDELGNVITEEVHTKDQLSIENLDITGNLLACVQELNSQIELLKIRISTLENP
jgi:hypothetical protein